MGLSSFARRVLPAASFPRLEGQGLPDPTEAVDVTPVTDDRVKSQGRVVKDKPAKTKPDPRKNP